MTVDEAYASVTAYLIDVFEIPKEQIRPEALLQDDLDFDSIDAVDLMVKLQEATGRKVTPKEFESIRTVRDLAVLVQALHNCE